MLNKLNLRVPFIHLNRNHHQSRNHDDIVIHHNHLSERVIRRKLICDWNEQTQQLFLALIRQHRISLSDLISTQQTRIISAEEFHYYNVENDRLIEDTTVVQGIFKRTIRKEKEQKKKKRRNNNKSGKKVAQVRKEIQREIHYLIIDIYEFKQTFFRQQQRYQQDDGKEETAESKLLFHMTIVERSLIYKNLFSINNTETIHLATKQQQQQQHQQSLAADGNECDECAICLEDISPSTTTTTRIVHSENTECKHIYCEDCIVGYFSNKQRHLRVVPNEPTNPCPICRREYCSIITE